MTPFEVGSPTDFFRKLLNENLEEGLLIGLFTLISWLFVEFFGTIGLEGVFDWILICWYPGYI